MDFLNIVILLCLGSVQADSRFGNSQGTSGSNTGRISPSFNNGNSFGSGDDSDFDDDVDGSRIVAWPNGVVPYEIDSSISNSDASTLKSMLNDLSRQTCVQFLSHRNEANYALFTSGTSCSAPLGVSSRPQSSGSPMRTATAGGTSSRSGSSSFNSGSNNFGGSSGTSGASVVKLAKSCFQTKRLARRIMNLLGIPHEASRPDRDQFVTINFNNIRTGYANNIKQIPASSYLPGLLDLPYDYQSVTQYSDSDLAKDKNQWAIKAKSSRTRCCGGDDFSKGDIQKIQKAYRCRSSG